MEGKRYDMPKPVSPGDKIEVEIESVGGKGDGIGKVDGFVIFVKGAQRSKKYNVKVTEVKRTYAMGEIIDEVGEAPAKDDGKGETTEKSDEMGETEE